jgi:hypothetical protein
LAFSVYYSTISDSYGSQDTPVTITNSTIVAGTSWVRSVCAFTVPSNAVGLKVGIVPEYYQSSGVVVYFAGMQLERGNFTMTPFEQRPIGTELALCQRYYYSESDAAIPMYPDQNGTGSRNRYFAVQFPVTMRTEGTASGYTGTGTPSVYYITPNNCVFYKQSSTNTLGVDLYSWTIDAEL